MVLLPPALFKKGEEGRKKKKKEVLHLSRCYTHTLDKNGSFYDPAGTESWNMQIRQEPN